MNTQQGNQDELRELLDALMLRHGSGSKHLRNDLLQLIHQREQSIAKAYGGCTDCYGKGYATANEFASGRGAKWRISNMRFCGCGRGKQLKEMFDIHAKIERSALLAEVEERVVGEDAKFPEGYTGDPNILTPEMLDAYVEQAQFDYKWHGGRNNLRDKQRQTLQAIREERGL